MSIGGLFDISVRTMSTYQEAINVSSNNISNAGNPDYTRQRVLLASEANLDGNGAGVKMQDVMRVRQDVLDTQIRKYQSTFSDADKRSVVLQQIETLTGEPSSTGISAGITDFFNTWNELSANPTSSQLRLNVVQKAQNLSQRFKQTVDGLTDIQYSVQQQANSTVDQINGYLKQIHDLNLQVYDAQSRGVKASELEDQRDSLIDQLSQLVNVSVQKSDSGAVQVNVGGSYGADQSGYNQFQLANINGQLRLVSVHDTNSVAVVNSGQFNALSDLYSNKIPGYLSNLENLENTFVSKVNELHMQGYTLSTTGASTNGIPFFGEVGSSGVVNAVVDGELKINSSILTDPGNIAASDVQGADGNSNVSNKIASLLNTKFLELNNLSFSDGYSSILNSIGLDKNQSDNEVQSDNTIMLNLKTQKQSYSGVSIDEEMTNIMKYQRSYDAAAKMIKIADDMIQTLLNMF